MASTIQLSRTIQTTQTTLGGYPLMGVLGYTNEPGFSLGDWVRNLILSPPFAWRWNRAVATFATAAGTQDYSQALATFGWVEKIIISDGVKPYEMEIAIDLPSTLTQQRPHRAGAQLDDDAGNITFRFFPVPDKIYTATVIYQLASPNFANLTDTWAPIPDYLSYIYNEGFLAKAFEYVGDPRYGGTMQLFLRLLNSANEGLSDTQKNLFITMQQIQSQRQGPAAIRATERESVPA